jgi:hypothetical protein
MAKFPDLTGDGEVTQADILKGRGVKAAKKGGLMKKKRYDDGGEVEFETKIGENEMISKDPGIRERAMKFVEEGEKAAPKAKPKAETKPKAEPKPEAKPKAAAPKAEPKKASGEEPSFLKGTKGFKNIGEAFKAMRRSAGITSYKSGGSVSSASKRADGCATKGKTKGRMV